MKGWSACISWRGLQQRTVGARGRRAWLAVDDAFAIHTPRHSDGPPTIPTRHTHITANINNENAAVVLPACCRLSSDLAALQASSAAEQSRLQQALTDLQARLHDASQGAAGDKDAFARAAAAAAAEQERLQGLLARAEGELKDARGALESAKVTPRGGGREGERGGKGGDKARLSGFWLNTMLHTSGRTLTVCSCVGALCPGIMPLHMNDMYITVCVHVAQQRPCTARPWRRLGPCSPTARTLHAILSRAAARPPLLPPHALAHPTPPPHTPPSLAERLGGAGVRAGPGAQRRRSDCRAAARAREGPRGAAAAGRGHGADGHAAGRGPGACARAACVSWGVGVG